jgi:hypothetical protein
MVLGVGSRGLRVRGSRACSSGDVLGHDLSGTANGSVSGEGVSKRSKQGRERLALLGEQGRN